MSFKSDADSFARFLGLNEKVPEIFGRWVGGFMMIAHDHPFYVSPIVWTPDSAKSLTARVYFDGWSQNKLPALRILPGRYFFCAVHRDVFAKAGKTQIPIFGTNWRGKDFSGVQTREVFDAARERFQWLKDQLA